MQIYFSFSPELTSLALSAIASCIRDVFSWMTSNKLAINHNKTDYLLLNPSNINLPVNTINIDSKIISPSHSAKNLGVIFQTDMSLDKHHPLLNHASFPDVSVLLSVKMLL